jgi:hypothetical protein
VGFFIFLIIVGIALSAIQKQRQSSTWQSVARHTGLAANSGSFFSAPTMSGTVRGVQVRVEQDLVAVDAPRAVAVEAPALGASIN